MTARTPGPRARAVAVALCATILPVREAAAAPVDASVWTALASVRSIEAAFTQTQHRAILRTPLQSHGTFAFKRPGSLRWEVTRPAQSTFTLEGSVATLDIPGVRLHERYDLAAVPAAGRVATSLLVWLEADGAAVERRFDVTYGQSPPTVRLAPREAPIAALFRTITLDLSPDPWRVRGVRFDEPDGDRVEIRFSSIVLDGVPVPDPAP